MKLFLSVFLLTIDVQASCNKRPGGYGEYVRCGSNTLMKGWCTSGQKKDCCGGGCSHELTCCNDSGAELSPKEEYLI